MIAIQWSVSQPKFLGRIVHYPEDIRIVDRHLGIGFALHRFTGYYTRIYAAIAD